MHFQGPRLHGALELTTVKPLDRLILASVILALAVNWASTFFGERFPKINLYAAIVLTLGAVVWGVYRVLNTLLQYLRFGRFAALIFFLSADRKLLLIYHPFHRRLLPPGGRLQQWELPHAAVRHRLREETGILDF